MKKAKILIVEDENIVAQDVATTLKKFSYDVVGTAAEGNDAIKKAESLKPDLILMDINLKGNLDGVEVSSRISHLGIPIIFLTAYSDDQKLRSAEKIGVAGYIVKPFEPNNLHMTIQMALQRHAKEIKLLQEKENYRFLYKKIQDQDIDPDLDLYDRKILLHLDCNSRISASALGKKIKLPKNTVNYRINRLIENREISRFYPLVDRSRLGYSYHTIIFRFSRFDEDTEKSLYQFLSTCPGCHKAIVTETDHYVKIMFFSKTNSKIAEFIEDFTEKFRDNILEKDILIINRIQRFNQHFFVSGNFLKWRIDYTDPKEEKLDELDINIIKELESDCRARLTDIAKKLESDPKVIKYRMNKMKENGIIKAYITSLDLSSLGRIFVQLEINLRDFSKKKSIIEFMNQAESCLFAYELSGSCDLLLDLYVTSNDSLNDIMSGFRKKFSESIISYKLSNIYRDMLINTSPE